MYTPVGHMATRQAGPGGLTASEHRLDNGLRVVLSGDHLNPVAAVCLWYDVGSRYEVKGRTGLAPLFEHLMFQGSAQVKGNGHFELVQGAGGSLNGTTSFERTSYFEIMPAHQLELALWLEADRMGSLLAALDEESLQNQRDVVKNERRQRYDNVPYGTAFERMTALAYPEGHPYHHIPIGSIADLDSGALAGAPSLGWLDVKASGGAEIPQIEAAIDEELARLRAEAPGAEEMERAQALVERGWLDRLDTVAGRADELCRHAVLFGDPQLAFTAVNRILDVTAEEVRAGAAARLRPDNRQVLGLERVTYQDAAGPAV